MLVDKFETNTSLNCKQIVLCYRETMRKSGFFNLNARGESREH